MHGSSKQLEDQDHNKAHITEHSTLHKHDGALRRAELITAMPSRARSDILIQRQEDLRLNTPSSHYVESDLSQHDRGTNTQRSDTVIGCAHSRHVAIHKRDHCGTTSLLLIQTIRTSIRGLDDPGRGTSPPANSSTDAAFCKHLRVFHAAASLETLYVYTNSEVLAWINRSDGVVKINMQHLCLLRLVTLTHIFL